MQATNTSYDTLQTRALMKLCNNNSVEGILIATNVAH